MRHSCRNHAPSKRHLETLHGRGKHGEAAQDPILRDVMGKEINSTSYEPSKVLGKGSFGSSSQALRA